MLKRLGFAKRGITTRFLVWSLLVAMVPLLTFAALSNSKTTQILKEEAMNDLIAIADSKIQRIETYILQQKVNATILARTSFIIETPERYDITFDESGAVIALDTVQTLLETDNLNLKYIQNSGEPTVLMVGLVPNEQNVSGTVTSRMNTEEIYALVQDYTGLGRTGEIVLGTRITNKAVVVAPLRHDPDAAFHRYVTIGDSESLPLQQAVQGKEGSGIFTDYRGEEVLAAWRYIQPWEWGMVIKMDISEAFAPANDIRNWFFIIGITTVFVVVLLAALVSRSVSEPIVALNKGVEKVGSGNLDYKVGIDTRDEIGQLSRTFNHMAVDLKTVTSSRDELEREIAERKQAQELFRNVCDKSLVGIYIVQDGKFQYVNPMIQRSLGYDEEELLGVESLTFVAADDMNDVRTHAVEMLKGERSTPYEYRGVNKAGDTRWVMEMVTPIIYQGKEATLGNYMDITERKRVEEALRQSEEFNSNLLNNSPHPIVVFNPDTSIEYVNRALENLTGFTSDELVGKQAPYPWLTEESLPKSKQDFEMAMLRGPKWYEELYQKRSGEKFWVEITAAPIIHNDKLRYYMSSWVDITERKKAEEEINEKAMELTRSNRELEHFAYVASHDLQEPLRKIQAFGDRLGTIYAGVVNEKGQDYIQRMQSAAERMQNLINSLLAFSRVTTRAQPFTSVNLTDVAQEVVSDLSASIERVNGGVEVGELPTIDADRTQMHQLLQNLISNGLKFYREEENPVVKVHSTFLDDKHCQIFVEDNGIGFDEKHLERIFTIFQRLHSRLEYEGTGIGLAIARKIVELHKGNITAESKIEQGSTFIITLPIHQIKEGEK